MSRRVVALALAISALAACGGNDDDAEPPSDRPGAVEVLAAGDVAVCDGEGDETTAKLVARWPEATVLALGDLAYYKGLEEEFEGCYEPSWGEFKDRTRPTPGNHEYQYFFKDASAYFDYFGEAAGVWGEGYYSFDLGSWHLIALNSNCNAERLGGCGPDSPQGRWLRDDLAKSDKRCTLAYWHHPRFSSGELHGNHEFVDDFWRTLQEAGAELVLNGHEHNYQRFAPDEGLRQFVVGTGGAELRPAGPELETTEVQHAGTYGVLRLTLFDGGYDWSFEPVEGEEFTDRGSARCA